MAPAGKISIALRGAVFVLVVAGLFVLFRVLPVDEWLGTLLEYVQSLGVWGPVTLGAAYVVATVAMVPAWILTVGSGFAFGLVVGTITVSIASTLGATAAFVVGRTFARGWVEKIAARNPKFAAVDRAVEDHGFKIVLLTRLSPVFPFNVLNYLYSLTSVRLRDYVLASWIGMFPGTLMYVYFGTAFKSLAEVISGDIEGGMAQKILLGVGLAVTVVVTVYVTRVARGAIRQYVDTEQATR
ncbi:MAG: TVP38/TMEM64 family protein [Acidobacteriota bacterium]|nr:TVP38/TMEM64 family protein [Acidobacteriota bacterium]